MVIAYNSYHNVCGCLKEDVSRNLLLLPRPLVLCLLDSRKLSQIGHFRYIKYSAWKSGSEDKDNRNTWELMWKLFTYHPLSFVFVLTDSLSSWILIYRKWPIFQQTSYTKSKAFHSKRFLWVLPEVPNEERILRIVPGACISKIVKRPVSQIPQYSCKSQEKLENAYAIFWRAKKENYGILRKRPSCCFDKVVF